MRIRSWVVPIWPVVSSAARFQPCPLLGATFQQPINLSSDPTFQQVRHNLTAALNNAVRTGNASGIALQPDIASFSVGVFDMHSTVYSFQHTAQLSSLASDSVKEVNENTIYRIASISKLFTVYLYMIEFGWKYWDKPVTEFLPQLKSLEDQCDSNIDPLDCIAWSEITLGSLASHLAGLPRDYGLPNITSNVPPYEVGLPPANMTSSEIRCQSRYACSEPAYLDGLSIENPTDAVYSQPIYSNAGFQILGYVFENITGKSFDAMLQERMFDPLELTRTTTTQPRNTTNAIIPTNATASLWNYPAGVQSVPWVGIYSTQSDLTKLGRSILNHTLLSPQLTRRWMKPVTHTSTRDVSVGMPWEILRRPLQHRVVDQYTKSGDIGDYHSRLALLPDYGVGYVILLAGSGEGYLAVEGLVETVSAALLPGLESTARAQAARNFAGVFRAPDGFNSSITLTTDPDLPALRVTRWISNGTDFLAFNALLFGEARTDVRLYPMNLQKPTATGGAVLRSYRVVTSFPGIVYDTDTMRAQNCDSWVNVDGTPYNEVSLDEMLIEIVDGRATKVIPRALEVTLSRAAEEDE